MDLNAAIEKNREALKRVLAMLVAMAGLGAASTSPLWGGRRSPDRRVGVSVGAQPLPQFTLPRHLYRAVLALLRPAEAAVRRLVILAARDLVVTVPRPRPRKPKPMPAILRNGIGTGIVMPPLPHASFSRAAPRTLALPLFDPLPGWGYRHRPVARSVPRICVPGYSTPFPIPTPPSPDDPIDARRLALRLQALGRALDDLPREARRFARRRCRDAVGAQDKELRDAAFKQNTVGANAAGAQNNKTHAAGRFRRVWPLRPGRPPGWCRNPTHEVHEILNVVHGLAFWALEDTS